MQGSGPRAKGQEGGKVRGTQSFVGVMGRVWKRPALTGVEVLWRWMASGPVMAVAALGLMVAAGNGGRAVYARWLMLGSESVFKPVELLGGFRALWAALWPVIRPVVVKAVPVAMALWVVGAAVGRAAVLRRVDERLKRPTVTLLVLAAMRVEAVVGLVALWGMGIRLALAVAIVGPAARGGEPSVLLASAMVIVETLALFMGWAIVSWWWRLAPLLAMRNGWGVVKSLREALRRRGGLHSKLIELNFVMGIVKVALIVLVMVFCACPLPFASEQTQTFLACWWAGVGVLYLVASDYFHVVRGVAYLELLKTYEGRE